MSRCRILAEGIWNAYTQGLNTEQAQLTEIAAHFLRYGVALERPYLNPGSSDQYELVN